MTPLEYVLKTIRTMEEQKYEEIFEEITCIQTMLQNLNYLMQFKVKILQSTLINEHLLVI
jgi:predicted nucleic acid-binding OB-fold protein